MLNGPWRQRKKIKKVDNIEAQLIEVGFENVNIEIRPKSKEFLRHWFPESGVERLVASADIEARKPKHASQIRPKD